MTIDRPSHPLQCRDGVGGWRESARLGNVSLCACREGEWGERGGSRLLDRGGARGDGGGGGVWRFLGQPSCFSKI